MDEILDTTIESAPVVEVAPSSSAPVVSVEEPAVLPAQTTTETAFVGSEDLNPSKRPLNIDVTGWEEGAINSYIRENGEEAFAAAAEPAPEAPKPVDKKEDEKETTPEDEIDLGTMLKDIGVTAEELSAYPEKIQEMIVDSLVGVEAPDKSSEIQRSLTQAESKIQELYQDPVIAARLEELSTGRPVVANVTSIATDEFITAFDTLVTAGKDEEARQLMRTEVAKAVAVERAVNDRKELHAKYEADLNQLFTSVAGLDPRLGLKETDLRKLNTSHPEYKKYTEGLKGVIDWVRDVKKWDYATIKGLGPNALYAAYSQDKGWDKERDQKIAKQAATKLMAKIKEAAKSNSAPDRGMRSVSPMQVNSPAGFDREALIDSLVKGQGGSADYDRLLTANERDKDALSQLFAVYDEAQRRIRSNHY